VDAISVNEGVSIMVDLPGFQAVESNGGKIEEFVLREDSKLPSLVIEGDRKLFYVVCDAEENPTLHTYNSSGTLNRLKVNEIGSNRNFGKFRVEVQLPVDVDDEKRVSMIQDGVYSIFIPKRKAPQAPKIRSGFGVTTRTLTQ
jgi:hypothetical protein